MKRLNGLKQIEEDFLWPQLKKRLGTSISKLENNRKKYGYYLEPIQDIHLIREGNLNYVIIFSSVGFLILLLVFTNFVNLFISSANTRFKEVGIRKTLGARKIELAKQFFMESTLLCTIAFVLAITITQLALRPINEIIGTDFGLELLSIPYNGILLFVLWAAFIFCSSAYPAFYLSSTKTSNALKGNSDFQGKSSIQKPLFLRAARMNPVRSLKSE